MEEGGEKERGGGEGGRKGEKKKIDELAHQFKDKVRVLRSFKDIDRFVDSFDPEKKFSESTTVSGFGLLGMRDRTILCDGRFEVASKKGEGTTVHISLPCDGTSIEG